jgi:hypothetical protein
LIDDEVQQDIAKAIDRAVAEVLAELPNHGGEEGLTPVLGHALMKQSFRSAGLTVEFKYRQLNKQTEEPRAGADGGFLVRVTSPVGRTVKASLFQAKLLKGKGKMRGLSLSLGEARRLKKQCARMLRQSEDAVALFYTTKGVHVVDARRYKTASRREAAQPLARRQRVITLGTYLGSWLPRCTRGDQSKEIVARLERASGFKHGLTLEVVSERSPIPWRPLSGESVLGPLLSGGRKKALA